MNKNFIAIIKKNWKAWVIYAILVSNILWQVIKVMGYAIEEHYIFHEFISILGDLDRVDYEMVVISYDTLLMGLNLQSHHLPLNHILHLLDKPNTAFFVLCIYLSPRDSRVGEHTQKQLQDMIFRL